MNWALPSPIVKMSEGVPEPGFVPTNVCTPAKLTEPLLGVLAVPALKLSATSTLPVVIVLKSSVFAEPPPTYVSTAPAAAWKVVSEQSDGDVHPVNSLIPLKLAIVGAPNVASLL